VKLADSVAIILMFTVISIIRRHLVRRFFAAHLKRFAAQYQDLYDDFKCAKSPPP
jgi:hypothetical protein